MTVFVTLSFVVFRSLFVCFALSSGLLFLFWERECFFMSSIRDFWLEYPFCSCFVSL